MPFRIKKLHHKKTLRRLQKKYDINRGELDILTPHSPISYDSQYTPEIPPHNMSSPTNPYMGQNTRRSSQVNSQPTTPLINHTTGSPVIDLASLRSLPSSPVASPRGGRTRKQVRRSRGGTRRGPGYRRRGLTRRVTRGQNRNQRSSSNSANSANDNSDSEHSNATTPDIPYITHRL